MEEGLDAVIINPSLIIGKGAPESGTGALFALLKKGLRYYSSGSNGVVDVEDVARVATLLMDRKDISGERFIVNAANISYQQLLTSAAEGLQVSAPAKEARPWMLSIAWRAAAFIAGLSGQEASLTKETAEAASRSRSFSDEKLKQTLSYQYKDLSTTLDEISSALNKTEL